MTFDNKSIDINGVVVYPLEGTFEVSPIPYNAFAERTAKSMRIDHLGKVWEIAFTLPENLPLSFYKNLYDATTDFVVPVTFYNDFLGRAMTTTFYNSPFKLLRKGRTRRSLAIKLIGTEVF